MSPKISIRPTSTSKRALASQERQAQHARLNKMGRAILLLVATFLSFLTMGLYVVDQLYRPDAFVIERLKIVGNFRYLDPVDVENEVNSLSLGNFFSISLPDMKDKIESMPLVQAAEIRREWPNTLLVQISEQRPIMRWKNDSWVNTEGEVVDLPVEIELSHAVKLDGNKGDSREMLQQALTWIPMLRKSELELRELSLTKSHAYTLVLEHRSGAYQFELLLGRIDVSQRMNRFLALFDYQYRDQAVELERVDARYPDGIAVRAEELSISDSIVLGDIRQAFTKDSELGNRL